MIDFACLVENDIKAALGVTEPGAIAFAASKARSIAKGELSRIELWLNSGIYKNAYTCGIPNSNELGCAFAAALGAIGGDSSKVLEALESISEEHNKLAKEMIDSGKVTVNLNKISSDIYIKAIVVTDKDEVEVLIQGSHTNITSIRHNGSVIFSNEEIKSSAGGCEGIKKYSFETLVNYALTVPINKLEFLNNALKIDEELLKAGLEMNCVPMTQALIKSNGGSIISNDVLKTMEIAACGAIEARVAGVPRAAMSITGSGSHGILSMMPVYYAAKVMKKSSDEMLRAVFISCLVTIYIKEYSGKLSAACGCVMAGGTGTAVGLAMLKGGDYKAMCSTIDYMAVSITGMICHGGNPGCVMKALTGIETAYKASELALYGVCMDNIHSILGNIPEITMQNMGYVASPGMEKTENYIVDILMNRK